jgi:hypothetical protein
MNDSPSVLSHAAQPWRFQPGNTKYRAKQERVAQRLAQLMAEYDTSPAFVQVLSIVARYLDDAERCQTVERRVLAANSARRLLRDIPRKKRVTPSLQAALAAAVSS